MVLGVYSLIISADTVEERVEVRSILKNYSYLALREDCNEKIVLFDHDLQYIAAYTELKDKFRNQLSLNATFITVVKINSYQ